MDLLPIQPRLYLVQLDGSLARTIDVDRDLGHRFVMSLLNDDLNAPTPRESTATIWRVDPTTGELLISSRAVIADPRVHSISELPTVRNGDVLSFAAQLEAVHRRAVHIDPEVYAALRADGVRSLTRTPRSAVPRDEVPAWAVKLLAGRGFRVEVIDALEFPSRSWRPHRRRAPLNVVRLRVTVTVVDEAAATDALIRGVGRGLSFGCGLLRINS